MDTVAQTMGPDSAEQFAGKLIEALNGGATALMTSIGHRTGLFDHMAELGTVTSESLAKAAALDERYVREWLGAMSTSGFVAITGPGRYRLPPEHAASLTRAAGSANIAVLSQYIGLLGTVEDRIIECFRHGGGVSYDAFGRFQEVMSDDSGMSILPALLDRIVPLIPKGPERLDAGCAVLDVGCGSGRALNLLAKTFPRSRFKGYDLSKSAIETARADARREGLCNIDFEVADLASIQDRDAFDIVTAFDAIHDQAKPREVLAHVARALRKDGAFLMVDIGANSHHHDNLDNPIAPLLYTISCMHCMTVSLASGGEGLGAMWGEQKARALLAEAGFDTVTIHRLEHDIQNYYYIATQRE